MRTLVIGQNSVFQKTFLLSELKPGSVNRISKVFFSAGGKGANISRAALALGENPYLLSYAGGHLGKRYARFLAEDGIENICVPIRNETRGCTTLVEDCRRITEFVEPAPSVYECERREFSEVVNRELRQVHFLVIGGTAMQGESDLCYRDYVETAHREGVPVMLDSYRLHGRNALPASPDILKINLKELNELTHSEFQVSLNLQESFPKIKARFGIKWIIVTAGSDGAVGFDGESIHSVRPPRVELVNSIGSGDAFCGGVLASISAHLPAGNTKDMLKGCPLRDVLASGVAAGTANCLSIKPGHLEVMEYRSLLNRVTIKEGVCL